MNLLEKGCSFFRTIFALVFIISFDVVVVTLASLLEITFLLVRGIMPHEEFVLILPVYTRRFTKADLHFEHSASKQFFGLPMCFNSLGHLLILTLLVIINS